MTPQLNSLLSMPAALVSQAAHPFDGWNFLASLMFASFAAGLYLTVHRPDKRLWSCLILALSNAAMIAFALFATIELGLFIKILLGFVVGQAVIAAALIYLLKGVRWQAACFAIAGILLADRTLNLIMGQFII